jgi:hypothetical protein
VASANELLLLAPIVVTSSVAYVAGRRLFGLTRAELGTAAHRTIECLGIGAAFFVVNVLVGGVAVMLVRSVTSWFVALYVLSDASLALLSFLQGLTFWWWRSFRR